MTDTQVERARAQSNGEITRLMIGDVVVRTETDSPFWRGRFKELAGEINSALQSEREAAAAEARRAALEECARIADRSSNASRITEPEMTVGAYLAAQIRALTSPPAPQEERR